MYVVCRKMLAMREKEASLRVSAPACLPGVAPASDRNMKYYMFLRYEDSWRDLEN